MSKGKKSYLKETHLCVPVSRLSFSDSHQQIPVGTGCTEPAVGASPGGAASVRCAKFWSGSDASGRAFWGCPSVSQPRAEERPAAHAGSGLEINPRLYAGKLVLSLRQGVKLLSKTAGGCCSVASLTSPRASSPSAIGVALGLVLEGFFVSFARH